MTQTQIKPKLKGRYKGGRQRRRRPRETCRCAPFVAPTSHAPAGAHAVWCPVARAFD